jgi:hypothetical protein
MDKESVLPAQTKDKKRINDEEVEVYIAWQSCLYVTNFPEYFDKAAMEQLFSKVRLCLSALQPSQLELKRWQHSTARSSTLAGRASASRPRADSVTFSLRTR